MLGPDQYARAKSIFLAASRLPKGDRTRYLNAECAEDTGLARQVRQLLTLDEQDPEFLEAAALEAGSAGLSPGTHLGRFTIERLLGEGGMGVVYEAQEDEPSRRVALKIIRPGFVSPRLRSRFRHEIRVLGQLRHPGIAQIYEAGTLELGGDHVPYFAMELVVGRPLLDGARALSIRERLILIVQICDAVHHAHQKGVIHRDLKPANILVEDASGTDPTDTSGTTVPFQVKILDFGIARAADSEVRTTAHTDAGQLVGTPAYMSPEQARGAPDAVDIRSDVYSIGVIAFELLVGRHPLPIHGQPVHEIARVIREAEPARLGSLDRELRGDIETIFGKTLEKDRQHRYQSAAELAADVRRCLRDEPIVARPASALYQLRKFARRHKALVAASTFVMAALVGATVVSTWQARIAMRARATAELERGLASESARAARIEARRATLAAAAAAIDSGDPITARRMLDDTDSAQRGWAWSYWHARLDDCVAVFHPSGKIAGAWVAPHGDRVVVLTDDGHLSQGDLASESLSQGSMLAGAPVTVAAFADDGASVAAVCGQYHKSLDTFDTRDGSLIRHVADLPARGALIEGSADAKTIVVAVKSQSGVPVADDVWLYGASEGQRVQSGQRTSGLAITPDGLRLVLGYSQTTTWESPDVQAQPFPDVSSAELVFAISETGALIATGGANKTVRIRDARAGKELPVIRGHAGSITALAFDPSAAVLASAGSDLTIRLWDVKTGSAIAVLAGHTGRIRQLRFCRDGSRLMSTSEDGSIRLWAANPYETTSVLPGHTGQVYGVAITPDGSRIVSGAWDQTVRVWDARSGACQRIIPAAGGVITAIALSPDGRAIATGHKIDDWKPAQISLWDIDSGRELERTLVGRGEMYDLTFDPAGSRLWCGWENGGTGALDISSHPPAMKNVVKHQGVFAMAVSPDQRELARGGANGQIVLLDAVTGVKIREWSGHRGRVAALAYHPKTRMLASGSFDGTVKLWNPDTGEPIASLNRHWDKVYCLAFSPDGDLLASGSEDTTIRIWDVASASELTQLRGHEAFVYSLAFSPDGATLVSGSGDHTVRVWDTHPVNERWRARAGASRGP